MPSDHRIACLGFAIIQVSVGSGKMPHDVPNDLGAVACPRDRPPKWISETNRPIV